MPGILLVEDDEGVRPILQHTLISAGHDVDTAGTMESGIIMLEHRAYDLVIADAKLRDGTGMAVVDQAVAKGVRGTGVCLHVSRRRNAKIRSPAEISSPRRNCR